MNGTNMAIDYLGIIIRIEKVNGEA